MSVMTTAPLDAGADAAKPESGDFKECQRLFGLSESTVRRLDEDGEVSIIRLRIRGSVKTGRTLVNFDSVRAYLKREEEATARENAKRKAEKGVSNGVATTAE